MAENIYISILKGWAAVIKQLLTSSCNLSHYNYTGKDYHSCSHINTAVGQAHMGAQPGTQKAATTPGMMCMVFSGMVQMVGI